MGSLIGASSARRIPRAPRRDRGPVPGRRIERRGRAPAGAPAVRALGPVRRRRQSSPAAAAISAPKRSPVRPADGYTLLLAAPGPLAVNQSLYSASCRSTRRKDFTPVALDRIGADRAGGQSGGEGERPSSELIALAKARRASSISDRRVNGSTNHLAGELFKSTGRHRHRSRAVSRRGAGDERSDLRPDPDDVRQHAGRSSAGAGRQDPRACRRRSRRARRCFPSLPTMVEAGVASFEASSWFGLVAPAKVPPDVTEGAD